MERITYWDAGKWRIRIGDVEYSGKDVDRIASVENIFGDNYDLTRLRNLVEADREGRVKIHPKPEKNTCGSCGHFHRIPGLCCGTCETQSRYKNKHGQEDERRGTFTPSQSRKACKNYIPMEGEQHENQT